MPGVIHFEIPADDLQRASAFYESVFGWTVNTYSEGYLPMITNGSQSDPGIHGAIQKRPKGVTSTCNTIDVASVDSFLDKIEAAGGACLTPKFHVDGVGHIAYCQDTEGNRFGIVEYEATPSSDKAQGKPGC